MKCWSCGAELNILGKISFRENCESCDTALHCCCNCVYYKPGLPNDCMVPDTDYVADRTTNNFCEEFKILGKGPEAKVDPKSIAKKLFGDDGEPQSDIDPKNRFDNLFGD